MAKRKEYSKEFKEEAVRLAQESDNTSETAHNLDLHLSIPGRWQKEAKQEGEKAFELLQEKERSKRNRKSSRIFRRIQLYQCSHLCRSSASPN